MKRTSRRRRMYSPRRPDGYLSGLEANIAKALEKSGASYLYESERIPYIQEHTYTPDFKLSNGIYIEGKGLFESSDRTKHLLIQKQHPELDIRFVFTNARTPLYRGSRTTYGDWCTKHGFKYATGSPPAEWGAE